MAFSAEHKARRREEIKRQLGLRPALRPVSTRKIDVTRPPPTTVKSRAA